MPTESTRLGRFDVERGDQMLLLRVRSPNGLRIATGIFVAWAVALAAAAPFVAASVPGMMLHTFLGIYALVLSAVWGDKLVSAGLIQRVARSLEVRWRDSDDITLVVDGETFDGKRVTTVVLRTVDNGQGKDIFNLYLALDDRAFIVESSLQEEPIRDLTDELRDVLGADTPDEDGEAEPLRGASIFIVVLIMLAELAAMAPAMLPMMSSYGHTMTFVQGALGPLGITVVGLVFAALYRPCCRWIARRRVKDMFGIE